MKELLLDMDEIKFEIETDIIIGTVKLTLMDLALAKKITKHRLVLQEGKRYPILSNIRNVKDSTRDAREFLASEEGCEGVIKAAILIKSPVSKIIANFFINTSRPIVPTKIFTDERKAKKWLLIGAGYKF